MLINENADSIAVYKYVLYIFRIIYYTCVYVRLS